VEWLKVLALILKKKKRAYLIPGAIVRAEETRRPGP
jgi:hypothetical protein